MKRLMCGVSGIFMALFLSSVSFAQVSNFLVNGMESGAVSAQGDVVNWQYNLSIGGTAAVEIWVDVDSNSVLDTTDFRLYRFDQVDGGESNEGPPDMDGNTNGVISVQFPHGLAPAHYFIIAAENNVADSVNFHVTPLLNPSFSIFGEVKDGQGKGIPWIPLEANAGGQQTQPGFWNAFTDSSGHFVIYLDSSAVQSNQPWIVEINRDALKKYIISGRDTSIFLEGDHGPILFQLLEPAMFISGSILDEQGKPLQEQLGVWAWNENRKINRNSDVDSTGLFTIAFAADDTGKWQIGTWRENDSQHYMEPLPHEFWLTGDGDSLITNFTMYTTDDTIWGQLIVDENLNIANREIMAMDSLTGTARDTTNSEGFFAIPVSSQTQQYELHPGWQTMDEFTNNSLQLNNGQPFFAAPGDTVKLVFKKQRPRQIIVTGIVADETGAALPFPVDAWAQQDHNNFRKNVPVNPNGSFEFFFQEPERGVWNFGISSPNWDSQFLFPRPDQLDLYQIGDSAHVEFVVHTADDSIWGEFLGLDSTLFKNQTVFASNETAGSNFAHANLNGQFVIAVSSVGNEYKINLEDSSYQQVVQAGFYLQTQLPLFAAPGDTVHLQFSNAPVVLGNLLVNGQKSGTEIQQGAMLQWSFQLPVGATVNSELWVDKNNDSSLTQVDDLLLFPFSQTDGGFGKNGPPDSDGLANGSVLVQMPLGLAPTRYFLRVFDATNADTAEFKILPITQPQQTVFGRVLNENGQGLPWVMVQAEVKNQSENMPTFRYTFTDSSGNYIIAMDGAVQSPQEEWHLNLFQETLHNQISLENEFQLNITGNHGPFDFHVVQPKMFVHGVLTDETGNPLFSQLTPYAWNERQQVVRTGKMIDSTGSFILYFSNQDTGSWEVGVNFNEQQKNIMNPHQVQIQLAQEGDTANVMIQVYHTDEFIYGKVFADGEPIVANRRVEVENDTTGSSEGFTGPDGLFMIPVSSVAQKYNLRLGWNDFEQLQNAGFRLISPEPLFASPGDTVKIEFSRNISDVSEVIEQPVDFSLHQNYPNPFSIQQQVATIVFSVPASVPVQISVFNILGQKVAELFHDQAASGKHTIHWSGLDLNGYKLSTGVYFIKMIAPDFIQQRKMLIVR